MPAKLVLNANQRLTLFLGRNATVCVQVTTFGKRGAVMLDLRPNKGGAGAASTDLGSVITSLFTDIERMPPDTAGTPSSLSGSKVSIFPGQVVSTATPIRIRFDRTAAKQSAALEKALRASAKEAESEVSYIPDLENEEYEDEESPQEAQEITAQVRCFLGLTSMLLLLCSFVAGSKGMCT